MTTGTVFVLGAGFSYHQGLPLMSDLNRRVIAYARTQEHREYQWLARPHVARLIDDLEKNSEFGFEEAIGQWARDAVEHEKRHPAGQGHREAVGILRVCCADLLWTGGLGAPSLLKPAYLAFAEHLKSRVAAGRPVAVVTLNWDLVLEAALEAARAPWSYDAEQDEIQVIKPHGSINFTTQDVIGTDPRSSYWISLPGSSVCYPGRRGDLLKDPWEIEGRSRRSTWIQGDRVDTHYLVQPGDKELDELWAPAVKALELCTELGIIGYSLPAYDLRAAHALRRIRKHALVKIVDPQKPTSLVSLLAGVGCRLTVNQIRFEASQFNGDT